MIRLIRNYFEIIFQFTSTDRGAFFILIPLLFFLSGWPRLSFWLFSPQQDPPGFIIHADSLLAQLNIDELKTDTLRPILFDPNQLSAAGFQAMGLDSMLASRIIRYREKGGKFRKPDDLLRIWGMDTADWKVLRNYIRIAEDSDQKPSVFKKTARSVQYDINLADTTDFESVKGIGSKMAARIVKYRSALGGFVRKEQLYEVFDIDSLAVFSMDKFFIGPEFVPDYVDLNGATYEELEAHPYLSRTQAKAILFYRYQHGPFQSPEDVRKVRLMDQKTLERLMPYIRFSVP
ncbi:MAG: ComEA family DNA-binding protein [Cyclobacteriaceae bacterium]